MQKKVRVFYYVLFLVFITVWIYPLIWTITASIKPNVDLYSGSVSLFPNKFRWYMLLPNHWTEFVHVFKFSNFPHAWYVASFEQFFINTAEYTVLVVFIVISLCSLTGYVLGRYKFPGKKLFMGAIVVTMFIPHGYTIIPIWKIIVYLKLDTHLIGMVLAEVGGAHVLFILLFTAYFASIPLELEEAALIDGAGFIRIFSRIMFPLSMPVVATSTVLQFMWTWNSFFIPLIFSINQPSMQTLGVGMLNFTSDHLSDLSGMAAGAVISFLPIILIFLFFQRYFVEGIAGAVKQ